MLTDERAVFSFRLSVGHVGPGKEAGVPNLMIGFEGFVGVSWTGQSALRKSAVFSSHFLVISSQKIVLLDSFPFVMLR
jgi:hypothetical protein